VINATGGQRTLLGGSALSPNVRQAMEDANRYYVDMEELLEVSGQVVAGLLGAEAAYITSGCCAALALGTAACMAGRDPVRLGQLPDVTGMRHEVLIQKGQRYKYDRCVTSSGARLVEVGDGSETSPEQIEAAIGERTVVGADLVGYGAKYFGAPNSTGVLCGRKDLVQAAASHGFIGFEASPYRSFGRPMKLDRQEIVAVVVALREWIAMDHQDRFESYARRVQRLQEALEGMPNVELAPEGDPVTGLRIVLDERTLGKTVAEIASALQDGDPSIWVRAQQGAITVSVRTLMDGDELVIANRLRELL
jgi:L-seryl-tRNA(Ser) seleniumtransferase